MKTAPLPFPGTLALEWLLASGERTQERLRALVHHYSIQYGQENQTDDITAQAWASLPDWQKQ